MNNYLIKMNPFVAMEILAFIFLLILLISILNKWKKTETSTKIFALNLIFIMIGIIFDILAISCPKNDLKKEALYTFFCLLCGTTTTPGFSYYCTIQANRKTKIVPFVIPRIILIINGFAALLEIIAFSTGTLFSIENNTLVGGFPAFFIIAIEFISTIIMTITIICIAKKIVHQVFISLILLMIISTAGTLAEMFMPGVFLSYTSISISALVQYVLLQSRLISEAEMREQIEGEISRTDVMTGLQNRRAYTELIDSLNKKLAAGVAFFDVNGLKRTNDEQGHVAGDKLIIRFSQLLKDSIKEGNLFRISGDEFVAIYIGAEKQNVFNLEMEAAKSAIENNSSIASMGTYFAENENILNIITTAEKFMYQDKHEYYIKNHFDRRQNRR